jgi:hypothetical protein
LGACNSIHHQTLLALKASHGGLSFGAKVAVHSSGVHAKNIEMRLQVSNMCSL